MKNSHTLIQFCRQFGQNLIKFLGKNWQYCVQKWKWSQYHRGTMTVFNWTTSEFRPYKRRCDVDTDDIMTDQRR